MLHGKDVVVVVVGTADRRIVLPNETSDEICSILSPFLLLSYLQAQVTECTICHYLRTTKQWRNSFTQATPTMRSSSIFTPDCLSASRRNERRLVAEFCTSVASLRKFPVTGSA